MMRPERLYQHFKEEFSKQLVAKAIPNPRTHFRASELGSCELQIYLDMIGSRPRPERIEDRMIGYSGNAGHDAVREAWEKVYVLGFVEATDLDKTSLQFKEEYRGKELGFHIRPDGVIIGVPEEMDLVKSGRQMVATTWPSDEHTLLEIKTTTQWGVKKARENPGEWWPSWVLQCQISMHFLKLKQALLLQVDRNFYDMIGDSEGFDLVKYDPKVVEYCFEKCHRILGHVERREPPDPGCPGRNFIFNRCVFNNKMVSGKQSEALCEGNR